MGRREARSFMKIFGPGTGPPIPRRPTGVIERALWTRTTLRVPLLVPRADGRITFFEIPSHPHPYTSTYSPAHREMEMEELNRLIIPDRLDPMTPLTPRYPTMMHVFISRLSRLALRSYHQWVAPTRLLPHIHVDSPHLLWGLINPNSNRKEYTVHENKMSSRHSTLA
ncbi:hypothetical protein YC2023_010587 [Brassica napus]